MSLADFWFSGAAKSLAPYLLAAAVTDRPIAQVARWIDAEERAEVLSIVRHEFSFSFISPTGFFPRYPNATCPKE